MFCEYNYYLDNLSSIIFIFLKKSCINLFGWKELVLEFNLFSYKLLFIKNIFLCVSHPVNP